MTLRTDLQALAAQYRDKGVLHSFDYQVLDLIIKAQDAGELGGGQSIALGAGRLFVVTGAPDNAVGANGDFLFRADGTVAASTVIYHKQAGAWVALLVAT